MNLLKYWKRWLTPEEEKQLEDPTRRVFCFMGIATVASLYLPKTFRSSFKGVDYEVPWQNPWAEDPMAQTIALQLERVRDKLPLLYERDDIFFKAIKNR